VTSLSGLGRAPGCDSTAGAALCMTLEAYFKRRTESRLHLHVTLDALDTVSVSNDAGCRSDCHLILTSHTFTVSLTAATHVKLHSLWIAARIS